MQRISLLFLSFLSLLVPASVYAELDIDLADFLQHPSVYSDLNPYLKEKGNKFNCDKPLRKAVKEGYSGIIAKCQVVTERVSVYPLKYENIRRETVTAIWQLQNGMKHGVTLLSGKTDRTALGYKEGRLLFRWSNQKKTEYPDCAAQVSSSDLLPVPKSKQFVARNQRTKCPDPNKSNGNYLVYDACPMNHSEALLEGRARSFAKSGHLEAEYHYQQGELHGRAVVYQSDKVQIAEFDQGFETRYIGLDPVTCEVIPESDPQKRVPKFTKSNMYWPDLNGVPAYRPDSSAAQQKKWYRRKKIEMIQEGTSLVGGPILIWLFPEWYKPWAKRTAILAYSLVDNYAEVGLGMVVPKTKNMGMKFQAFHYHLKHLGNQFLWGPRYSVGGGAFFVGMSLQTGLYFNQFQPTQVTLGACAGTILNACIGMHMPLALEHRDLEHPLQLSLKIGL